MLEARPKPLTFFQVRFHGNFMAITFSPHGKDLS